MAVRDAYKLAKTQVEPGSGFGAKAGRALRNLAGAAADTVGGRLSGRQHFGTFGGQMSDNLQAKTPPAPPKEK
jgi:hypothetical protein